MRRRRRRRGGRQGDEVEHRKREHRRHGGAIAQSLGHMRDGYRHGHADVNANAYASGEDVYN